MYLVLCLKLNTFFTSNLAKRMQKAQQEGKLFREQPFLMERGRIYPLISAPFTLIIALIFLVSVSKLVNTSLLV